MAVNRTAEMLHADSSTHLGGSEPTAAGLNPRPRLRIMRTLVKSVLKAVLILGIPWVALLSLQRTPMFVVDPEDGGWHIEGLGVVREHEVAAVFGEDVGRSLADLDPWQRIHDVTSISWVESARVSRVWPNQIHVSIQERRPIAFLRSPGADGVRMIDAEGVILDPRLGAEGSMPVITGIEESMSISERRARVDLYREVVAAFSKVGRGAMRAISEVDLSETDNAIVLAQHDDQMIRLLMGDRHLEHRLDVFLSHIEGWQQEFGNVESVDLRFERQVAVLPSKEKS